MKKKHDENVVSEWRKLEAQGVKRIEIAKTHNTSPATVTRRLGSKYLKFLYLPGESS